MYHCAFLHHVRTPSIAHTHIYMYMIYIYIYHIYIYISYIYIYIYIIYIYIIYIYISHIYIYIKYTYMYHVYIYINNISLGFLFSSDHYFRHFQLSPCFMFSYIVYYISQLWHFSIQFSSAKQNKQCKTKSELYNYVPMKPLFQNDTFNHTPMITPINNWTWYWHHTSYCINKFRMTIQNDKHRPNSEWEIELLRVGFQFSDITKKDLTMPQSQRTYISYHIIIYCFLKSESNIIQHQATRITR